MAMHQSLRGLGWIGLLFCLAVVYAPWGRAAIIPGFDREAVMANATHIVLVERNHQAKGKPYKVVEAWRGELQAGYEFSPDELSLEVPGAEMKINHFSRDQPENVLTGERVVLFLIDTTLVEDDPRLTEPETWHGTPAGRWIPAGRLHLRQFGTSAVWLEGGRTYVLNQFVNPGPLVPIAGQSAVGFELWVKNHEWLQAKLDQAIADSDVEALAGISVEAAREHYGGLWGRCLETLLAIDSKHDLVFANIWLIEHGLHRDFRYPDQLDQVLRIISRSDAVAASHWFDSLLFSESQTLIRLMDQPQEQRWNGVHGFTAQCYGRLCAVLRHAKQINNPDLRPRLQELHDRLANEPDWQPPQKLIGRYGDAAAMIRVLLDSQPPDEHTDEEG